MIEMIENKIKQLTDEMSKAQSLIANLAHVVASSQAQIKSHESNVAKISGAIEAFQSTLNVMSKMAPSNTVNTLIDAVETAEEVIQAVEHK